MMMVMMILALSRCPSLLLNTSGFDTNQSQMTCFEALGCHVVQRAFIRHLWAFRRLRAAPKAQSCSQVFELCNAWISKVLEPMLAINTEHRDHDWFHVHRFRRGQLCGFGIFRPPDYCRHESRMQGWVVHVLGRLGNLLFRIRGDLGSSLPIGWGPCRLPHLLE